MIHTFRDTWKPVHAGGHLGDTVRRHRNTGGMTGIQMESVKAGEGAGAARGQTGGHKISDHEEEQAGGQACKRHAHHEWFFR